MAEALTLRPLLADDAEAGVEIYTAARSALRDSLNLPPLARSPRTMARLRDRIVHLAGTDPA